MERNQRIDFMKFIFSIGIVMIHVQLFKDTNSTLFHIISQGICRVGVPFFFIISGYYFYNKVQTGTTKNYLIKLLKLFCIFELCEIVIFSIPLLLTHAYPNIFMYIWRILSVGLGGAYWYIISLLLTCLIVKPLWKNGHIIPLLIVGFFLYLIVMTNDSYSVFFKGTTIQSISELHTMIWTWPQAGLFSSLFYVSIGALLHKCKFKVQSYQIIIMFILLIIEAYIMQGTSANDANAYFSLILLAPLLVLYCFEHPHMQFNTKRLGEMSLYIYMTHPFFNNLYHLFPINELIIFLFVLISTLGISYLLSIKLPTKRL